jgi:uncharacterized tellurite resistance protein B-like protein
MTESTVILRLAKVLVAAAWADGELSNAEINSLKDLTFHLPGMTTTDWKHIDIYIESPVGEAERNRLVGELGEALKTQADRDLALQALDHLIAADGSVSSAEQEVVQQIKSDLQGAKVSSWSRLVHGRAATRSQAVQSAPNRELMMDDYIYNKIYYDVRLALAAQNDAPEFPEAALRKLCLAGGLLARVAYADQQVSGDENQAIIAALQQHWGVSALEAAVVAKAAEANVQGDLDYYRLTRNFFEVTTEEERVRFLDVLFAVTTSDSDMAFEEVEEIRRITSGLLLSHHQFIDAKMKALKKS